MFKDLDEEDVLKDKNNVKLIEKINIKELFKLQNIIIYVISFMCSMVGTNFSLLPFGLAMFAATCSNGIPAIMVYISIAAGTLIRFGFGEFLVFLVSSIIFIILSLVFKPIEDEERNEKQKLGLFVFISVLIVQIVKMMFNLFLWYNLLNAIMLAILTYIFYKIFVNSISVIKDYGEKRAFSIEEILGACLLASIAIYALNNLKMFGLSISNIFCIMIILFLGWKNGVLIGGTSGITIGMVIGVIGGGEPILIASYAISGMLGGLLNKFRKNRCYCWILFRKCYFNLC